MITHRYHPGHVEVHTSKAKRPYARFDDLRPFERRSFELADLEDVLVAQTADDVTGVIRAAERAVQQGKWVAGFVSYEAAPGLDPALRVASGVGSHFEDLPMAWFGVFSSRSPSGERTSEPYSLGPWKSAIGESEHFRAVSEIQERIRHGDTYQVNFTFGLSAEFSGCALTLYNDLAAGQACGYGAYIDTGRWQIASASPELFFEWKAGRVSCRPMKGTARRGRGTSDDEHQRMWLLESEKDQAENVMIVDMVRNDVGRVAEIGSVATPALFSAEKYDTVWQLTSTVTAQTRPGTSLTEVFQALFPSASITGAPKVSTMNIIRSLEQRPRGVYCGTIGFGGLGAGGDPEWAFNVAIRTVVVDRDRSTAYYGTGGGITIDSTTEGEYREALLKTEVLARRTADFRLLETMVWQPDAGVWLLDRHLDRLMESARYFDIPLERAALETIVKEISDPLPTPAVIRLLVDRTGAVTCEVGKMPADSGKLRLVLDDRPTDQSDPLLYHKTTNRRVFDEALDRHPHSDDVILWNESNEVTETTIGNLAVQIDGEWLSPPVASGCLPGTYRAELLAQGKLRERVITVDELKTADSIARLNSVRGWEHFTLV